MVSLAVSAGPTTYRPSKIGRPISISTGIGVFGTGGMALTHFLLLRVDVVTMQQPNSTGLRLFLRKNDGNSSNSPDTVDMLCVFPEVPAVNSREYPQDLCLIIF